MRTKLFGQNNEWALRVERDETNIERILKERLTRTSHCVDIGAHQGVFLKQFLSLSPDGHHVAIEPLPDFASELRINFSTVDVFSCALGENPGQAIFCYVRNLPAWSGFRSQRYPVEADVTEILIDVSRLDDLLPAEGRVDFIKIDVEGAEFEVLQGAKNIIKRCKPDILFEHAQMHNLKYGTGPEMIYDLLCTECGLGIYSLDGVGPLSRREFKRKYVPSADTNYDRNGQTNFLAKKIT